MRDFAALWILAFVASIAIGSHGILYWDAGDYVTQALTGQLSGLLLGRPLFLWISRAVLAAGVDPVHGEICPDTLSVGRMPAGWPPPPGTA